MPTNPYFRQFNYNRQQDMLEKLIIESIKIWGINVYYIPRETVNIDYVFGEDVLSQFRIAAPIEMYVKSVDGYEGGGRFLSQMGIEIRDSIELSLSVKRFEQIRTQKLLDETNYNLVQESANTTQFQTSDFDIQLEDGNGKNYFITKTEPEIGDLIYIPMVSKLLEIKEVLHEELFYQFGKLMTYDLNCEVFQYSHERIDTGVFDIDSIEDIFSGDQRFFSALQEDGDEILLEDGSHIILDQYRPETNNPEANNEVFFNETDDIVDFSDRSPFIRGNRW